jgi:hypothetical protein
MSLPIVAEDINDHSTHHSYNKNPDICPLCFRHIQPKRRIAAIKEATFGGGRLQIIFRCTNSECDSFFIAVYDKINHNAHSSSPPSYSQDFYLEKLMPMGKQQAEFSETISKLSPSFIEIYNQAIAAESSNLEQIAGMGFRKALEFLIKDFAINQNPSDEEKIKETFLGTVIKKYIDDTRLKSTAERATWLGNDETHYVKKWIDKDINDLKLLIKLSVNWIENVLLTEEYASNMTP